MITSTALGSRVRISYLGAGNPDYRLNGVNPAISSLHFASFLQAIQSLQQATMNEAFIYTESELSEV